MRRTEMMTAGGVTLAGLGALVGLAIGSGGSGAKLTVPRAQPVEVRTEIIRKTVNVYRREHPHHAAGTGPAGSTSSGVSALRASAVGSVPTRTRTSGARAVAPAGSPTPVLTTRSSGARGTRGSSPVGNPGSTRVKTRTSGAGSSGGGSGSSHPVSTRSSGGGDGHGGGHDD